VSGLSLDREQIYEPDVLIDRIAADIGGVMLACLPLALAIMLVALASPLLIGGWNFSAKAFMPNFGKLNPMNGLGNMVSTNALVELLKALRQDPAGRRRRLVCGDEREGRRDRPGGRAAGRGMRAHGRPAGQGLPDHDRRAGRDRRCSTVPYQMWHYANKLKMTRQEVIQESKESDGNPQIKGKIRQLQREMARKRMMATCRPPTWS
jgi:flagellar biosynthetic protein FlhB